MSLFPYSFTGGLSPIDRFFSNFIREMDDLHRSVYVQPYRQRRRDEVDFAAAGEITCDENHFGVHMDVSSFNPNELNVSIDGRDIIVRGSHKEESENSSMSREFVRRYRIPKDVNPDEVRSRLDEHGHLDVEVPRHHASVEHGKKIPIEFTKKE